MLSCRIPKCFNIPVLQSRRQSRVGEWASTLSGLLIATLSWQVFSIYIVNKWIKGIKNCP